MNVHLIFCPLFEAEYSGEPGTMLLTLMSVSETGKHAFRVPLTDPAAISASAGGFPWYTSYASSTFVHLKNVEDPQQYMLQLDHAYGVLGLGLRTIEAGQSVSIDVAKLREGHDLEGTDGSLPAGAYSGQILWSVVGPDAHAIIAHSEQVDRVRGFASLYSCYNCCPDKFHSAWVAPGSAILSVGLQSFSEGKQQNENCYGTLLNPFTANGSWQTLDGSVASVNSSGTVTGLSPGLTSVTSSWTAYIWYYHSYYQACMYHITYPGPQAPVEVPAPTLNGPSSVTRGQSAQFTISNAGTMAVSNWKFVGDSATVNRSSNQSSTTWSGTMAQSGTVSVQVGQFPLARQITVNPRSGWATQAVAAQKVANGSDPELTVPNPPTNPGGGQERR